MNRRITAIHEAGHAVIGRVLTLACGSATIIPEGDAAGHSITHDPYTCTDEWEKRGRVRGDCAVWHARIITMMAGREAVEELLGVATTGDGEDLYQINLMLDDMPNSPLTQEELEAKYGRLRRMTRMLVRRHRSAIGRVADALTARETCSAEELDLIAGRSLNDVRVNAYVYRKPRQRGYAVRSLRLCRIVHTGGNAAKLLGIT